MAHDRDSHGSSSAYNDRILVGGEALFDIFGEPPNEATQKGAWAMPLEARVGGSPLNVAIGLARLQAPVSFVASLSNDWLGMLLRRALTREGIDASWVVPSNQPTTVSLVGIDPTGHPAYAFYGHESADQSLHEVVVPAAEAATTCGFDPLKPAMALHVGSIAATVGDSAQAYARYAATYGDHAHKTHHSLQWPVVSYDPNIRLHVAPDADLWRASVARWVGLADVIKVSSEDIALLWPNIEPHDKAKEWLNAGVSLVVITHSAKGSEAFTRHVHTRVGATLAPTVVDGVGAGDAFQAALLARLRETRALARPTLATLSADDLQGLLTFAGQAAALVVGRRGADPPTRALLSPRVPT